MSSTRRQRVTCALISLAVSGCAMTPQQFASQRESMSDSRICRLVPDMHKGNDPAYPPMLMVVPQRMV